MATLRGPSSVRFARVLGALALFALLAPTVGLLSNQQLAGWTPNHGHVANRAPIATHAHPYDDDHGVTSNGGSSDEVSFTLSDDAGGASVLALAREPATLPSPQPAVAASRAAGPSLFKAVPLHVPTPPPRS